MKFLVDTNVFLRFVEVDSPEFEECDLNVSDFARYPEITVITPLSLSA